MAWLLLLFSPFCTGSPDPTKMSFEGGGIDTDGDGIPNCADYDDDNDGLCDDAETLTSSSPGVPTKGCVGPDPCPLISATDDPLGLGCTEFVIQSPAGRRFRSRRIRTAAC